MTTTTPTLTKCPLPKVLKSGYVRIPTVGLEMPTRHTCDGALVGHVSKGSRGIRFQNPNTATLWVSFNVLVVEESVLLIPIQATTVATVRQNPAVKNAAGLQVHTLTHNHLALALESLEPRVQRALHRPLVNTSSLPISRPLLKHLPLLFQLANNLAPRTSTTQPPRVYPCNP
jgi:hypothetical protein